MPTKSTNAPKNAAWGTDWEVGVKVWVERKGAAILGEGKADLLQEIQRTRSITSAAKAMKMSYRHAWLQVQAVNDAAGRPLVAAAVGGKDGGGTRLTPLGEQVLVVFSRLRSQIRLAAASELQSALQPEPARSQLIHVAAAVSLQEAVGQVVTEFALSHPAIRVRSVFGASNELADQILAGAPCDLFLSADPAQVDRLVAAKRVNPKECFPFASNRLAIISAAKARQSVTTSRELLSVKFKRVVLADPASPLGKYSREYLTRLGIYDELLPKVIHVDNARGVPAAIRSGVAQAGLAFWSDATSAEGCRMLLAIKASDFVMNYLAAPSKVGHETTEVKALLAFLSSKQAEMCFRRCGLKNP